MRCRAAVRFRGGTRAGSTASRGKGRPSQITRSSGTTRLVDRVVSVIIDADQPPIGGSPVFCASAGLRAAWWPCASRQPSPLLLSPCRPRYSTHQTQPLPDRSARSRSSSRPGIPSSTISRMRLLGMPSGGVAVAVNGRALHGASECNGAWKSSPRRAAPNRRPRGRSRSDRTQRPSGGLRVRQRGYRVRARGNAGWRRPRTRIGWRGGPRRLTSTGSAARADAERGADPALHCAHRSMPTIGAIQRRARANAA